MNNKAYRMIFTFEVIVFFIFISYGQAKIVIAMQK